METYISPPIPQVRFLFTLPSANQEIYPSTLPYPLPTHLSTLYFSFLNEAELENQVKI